MRNPGGLEGESQHLPDPRQGALHERHLLTAHLPVRSVTSPPRTTHDAEAPTAGARMPKSPTC